MIKNMIDISRRVHHWWQDPLFVVAVSTAIILHLIFISIQVALPFERNASSKDIAVTLKPSSEKVKDADFLANKDQQGDGAFKDFHRMASVMPAQTEDLIAGEQQLKTLEQIQLKRELKFEEKVLMTVLSWKKQTEFNDRKKAMEALESQFQAKAAMVASLEKQYLQKQKDFSRQQKIKTVDGVQAKQDASAGYLEKFREKVEIYGNRFYPKLAKQQHLSGEVRLMVIVNPSGGIRAIRLIESSGHAILDEAAKNSVRKAAPFGVFDAKMKDISELRVIRTWKFELADSEFEVY